MRENRGSKYSFQVSMGAVNNWVTHLTSLCTLYDSYGDRTVDVIMWFWRNAVLVSHCISMIQHAQSVEHIRLSFMRGTWWVIIDRMPMRVNFIWTTHLGRGESLHKHDTTCTNCINIHQWGWLSIMVSQCQWTAVHVLLSLVLWIEKNTRPVIWEKKNLFILCEKNIRFLFTNERMKFYIFWRYAGLVLYRSVSIA